MPPAVIERELERHLDRAVANPVSFASDAPLAPAGEDWLDALLLVCRTVDRRAGDPLHPLAAATLQNLLVDGLLLAQRHNDTDELAAPSRAGSSREVRAAIELLHGRPEHPWSVGELAEQVHLSVRALQQAFRRDTRDSPMRYLRAIRLARVRDTLRAGDPAELTVTEAALRWGFSHHGHFAAAYRAQFGETPSETLHRRNPAL
jgi:transcriptional regulator GlxA family with amidase domain